MLRLQIIALSFQVVGHGHRRQGEDKLIAGLLVIMVKLDADLLVGTDIAPPVQ